MLPLVGELAVDGIRVAVTCRVLKLCRQRYYRRLLDAENSAERPAQTVIVAQVDLLPERVVSPRLGLRRWLPEDVALLRAVVGANIDHLRPWMAWIAFEPMSDGDRQDLIHSWQSDWAAGGDVVFGAFSGDTFIGGCGLHRRSGPETLEIGYWVHVDHLRKGYATEIAQALTSAALSVPGITRVEIHHDKANTRSAAVPRALGFHFEGQSLDEIKAPAEEGVDFAWSTTTERWTPTTATG